MNQLISLVLGALAMLGLVALYPHLPSVSVGGTVSVTVQSAGFAKEPVAPKAEAPKPTATPSVTTSDAQLVLNELKQMDARQTERDTRQDARIGRLEAALTAAPAAVPCQTTDCAPAPGTPLGPRTPLPN